MGHDDLDLDDIFEENGHALGASFALIIVSEIGDKTFLIAAILAMRHPRSVVFAGALASLAIMSFISAGLGHMLPFLIPKRWTQFAAAILFLVFGVRMGQEGFKMQGGNGHIQEEMEEARQEIEDTEILADKEDGAGSLAEKGMVQEEAEVMTETKSHSFPPSTAPGHSRRKSSVSRHSSASTLNPTLSQLSQKLPPSIRESADSTVQGVKNLSALLFSPIFVQAFILTFLGEWGDRSQVATIAMAAANNMWVISIGTILGHSVCTGLA